MLNAALRGQRKTRPRFTVFLPERFSAKVSDLGCCVDQLDHDNFPGPFSSRISDYLIDSGVLLMNEPDREETIFASLLGLPASQRPAYMDRACAGDADLRHRVQELVELHEEAGRFMEEPAAPSASNILTTVPLSEKPGDRIGRYKLME